MVNVMVGIMKWIDTHTRSMEEIFGYSFLMMLLIFFMILILYTGGCNSGPQQSGGPGSVLTSEQFRSGQQQGDTIRDSLSSGSTTVGDDTGLVVPSGTETRRPSGRSADGNWYDDLYLWLSDSSVSSSGKRPFVVVPKEVVVEKEVPVYVYYDKTVNKVDKKESKKVSVIHDIVVILVALAIWSFIGNILSALWAPIQTRLAKMWKIYKETSTTVSTTNETSTTK